MSTSLRTKILVAASILLVCGLGTGGVWYFFLRPVVISLVGPKKPVVCMAFSPDGRWLASAGDDNALYLHSADDGTLRRTLQGHEGHIMAVNFMYGVATGKQKRAFVGHGNGVHSIAFRSDGLQSVSASED